MHKAHDLPCQPAYPGTERRVFVLIACFLLLFNVLAAFPLSAAEPIATPAASPAPSPPVWQQELTALQIMRVSASLAPDQKNANGETLAAHTTKAFGELGRKYPEQPEIQKACGDYFFEARQIDRAFEYWLLAQKLNPNDADLAATLGGAYLHIGDTRGAALQFQRAVDAKPDVPQYHSALANVLYLFRHDLVDPPALPDAEAVLQRAVDQLQLAAQLDPMDRALAQAYAEAFYIQAKPDWQQALTAWRAVLALSGTDTDFANSHLARVSLRMKRPQDAEAYLDQLNRPDFVDVQTKLRAQAKKMTSASAARSTD